MAQPTRTRPAQPPAVQTPPPARDVPARVEPMSVDLVRQQLTAPAAVDQLRALLPAHVTVDRFVSTALLAVQRNPSLLNCTGDSLFQTVLHAARDGLLLDGREAAAVPFGKEAQYLRMVEGRLKLVRQSGQLRHIDAQIVYPEDEFDYYADETGPHLRHRPNWMSTRRDPKRDLALVYATATTLEGGVYIEVMTRDQVERARQVSRARDASAWTHWYDEQARKTVLNRLFKRLPKATDIPGTEDDDEARHPTVEAGVARGFGHDASIDMAAREARTRERWREQDAAKGYAPRRSASSPAAAPQPAPTPEDLAAKKRALWAAWQAAGLPKAQPARLATTSELLESHRAVPSWNTLTLAEVEELTAKARALADERAAAGAASDARDDAEADREPGDDAPADGPMQEIGTDLFPPPRRVGV